MFPTIRNVLQSEVQSERVVDTGNKILMSPDNYLVNAVPNKKL
jgi:hypothetical protein